MTTMADTNLPRSNPMRRVLAQRDFKLLWIGQLTSILGDQFYMIAGPWLVLKLTGDPLALGLTAALGALPRAATMLVGGAITDRFSPRRIMLISDFLRLVLTTIMVILVLTGAIRVWMIYLFSLVFGLISGFFTPASSAIVPDLLPAGDLQAGNSIFQGSSQLVGFVGPALAGAVIGLVPGKMTGIGAALAIDAVSFIASVVTLWLMRGGSAAQVMQRAESAVGSAAESVWSSIQSGIRYAVKDPFLRLIFIVIGFANLFFTGPLVVGVPILADQRLPGGATAYGLILSAYAGGNLLGIILCGALPRPSAKVMKFLLVGLMFIFGPGIFGLGWITQTWAGFILMLVMGVGNGYLSISLITTLQQRTPREMMGRLMSLLLLANIGLMPISQALAGLISRWSLSALFASAGLGLLLLGVWMALQPTLNELSNFMSQPANS